METATSDFETELAKGQAAATSNGWRRIVVGCATAIAPLAVAPALGTAIAHADTYAERGGGGGGGGGSHGGVGAVTR